MINLISQLNTSQLRAARRNVGLLRLNIFTFIVCAVAVVMLVAAYAFLTIQHADAQADLERANQEKAKKVNDIKTVNTFKDDLAAAKAILSSEITLSNLAIILTDAIPQGVVVDVLDVNPTSLADQQSIIIFAQSASDAITIKQQFNDSRYIQNAFIQDVTDLSATPTPGQASLPRPYRITMTYNYDIAAIIADTKKRTEEGR